MLMGTSLQTHENACVVGWEEHLSWGAHTWGSGEAGSQESSPSSKTSFSGCKANLENLREHKNVSERELVGKNTLDVTEVFTE